MSRNTLRYWLADAICQKFDICQLWLATGEEPRQGYVSFPPEEGLGIMKKEVFSAAFRRLLEHRIRLRVRENQARVQSAFAEADAIVQDRQSENFAYNLAMAFFSLVPPHLRQEFYGRMAGAASSFLQSHHGQINPLAESEKKKLTNVSEVRSLAGVKSPMKDLLSRLAHATRARGKKAALAKLLTIPASSISDWLDGRYEPSGEVTLRLLEWVTEEEARQQNAPDGGKNTVKGKTRSKESADEHQKSGPGKP
jgi:hypothetical protein